MLARVRPGPRIEEEELGAEQADSFGALGEGLQDLGRAGGVGEHAHLPPVAGHRRLRATSQRPLARRLAPLARLSGRGQPGGSRVTDQLSAVAVDHDHLSGADVQERGTEPDHQRDAERPGHDRGVGRQASARQGDALHLGRQLGDLGRADALGDQQAAGRLPADAGGAGGGSPSQAADVVGALGQEPVVEGLELGRHLVGGFLERGRGRAACRADERLHPGPEGGVAGH